MKNIIKTLRNASAILLTGLVIITPLSRLRADSMYDVNTLITAGAHRCNVSTPRDGSVFAFMPGNFDPTCQETILAQINQYRLEACQNGYPDPRNRNRGLTMADYHEISWSAELEETAMIRAAESSITMNHATLNGESWGSRSYGSAYGYECIAWCRGPYAAQMWYGERDAWLNNTSGAVTGHYTAMINPSIRYCGIAGFIAGYQGTYVADYSSGASPDYDSSKIDVSVYNGQIVEISKNNISGVTITGADTLQVGESTTLRALYSTTAEAAVNVNQNGIIAIPESWESSDSSVISIDSNGTATAESTGTTQISCTIDGTAYGSQVTVTEPAPVTPSPSGNPSSVSAEGGAPSFSGSNGGGTPAGGGTPLASGTGVSGFIDRLYTIALGRGCDSTGKEYWLNRVQNGSTGADLARGFLFSREFLGKNLTNEQFITILYSTFFNRTPDEPGKAYWLNRLNNGMSRQEVINGFINSIEWDNLCVSYGIESGSGAASTRASRQAS